MPIRGGRETDYELVGSEIYKSIAPRHHKHEFSFALRHGVLVPYGMYDLEVSVHTGDHNTACAGVLETPHQMVCSPKLVKEVGNPDPTYSFSYTKARWIGVGKMINYDEDGCTEIYTSLVQEIQAATSLVFLKLFVST